MPQSSALSPPICPQLSVTGICHCKDSKSRADPVAAPWWQGRPHTPERVRTGAAAPSRKGEVLGSNPGWACLPVPAWVYSGDSGSLLHLKDTRVHVVCVWEVIFESFQLDPATARDQGTDLSTGVGHRWSPSEIERPKMIPPLFCVFSTNVH